MFKTTTHFCSDDGAVTTFPMLLVLVLHMAAGVSLTHFSIHVYRYRETDGII